MARNPRKTIIGGNHQKIKLLKLYVHLTKNSDENHPLSTQQLLDYLGSQGIPCDRRTLAKDIAVLNDYGFDVISKLSRCKLYYVPDYNRSFDEAELRTLIDSVQAARFINPEKTKDLVRRIAGLAGEHRSRVLRDNIVLFNTNKSQVKNIFGVIDLAIAAIRESKKLSFRYCDLDEKREKVFRHGGARYVVNPMALVYRDDAYYLMCYNQDDDAPYYYRLERMESVATEEECLDETCREWRKKHRVETVVGACVRMYGNPETSEVTLTYNRGDYRTLGAILDRFGDLARPAPDRSRSPMLKFIKVWVQISPTFWAWVMQFQGKIGVYEKEYHQQLRDFAEKTLLSIENN